MEEGLELASEVKDRAKLGHILMDLGIAAAEQSDYKQAIEHMANGYTVANEIDNHWLIGLIEARWGHVELQVGETTNAAIRFDAALVWAEMASNNKEIIGLAQFGLAKAAFKKKDVDLAYSHIEQGIMALEGSGHKLLNTLKAWKSNHLF
ncbi:MAG: hypothetical protein KDC85_24445 [Saprospiraceae bacterium]|nr:hypothetical protein [Saprospiraceae bacterium]